MTAMAEKMKAAGLDTDKARLDSIACDVMRQAKQNVEVALRRFSNILRADGALLDALARPHLRQIAADMRPTRDGVSHNVAESQSHADHSVSASNKVRSSQRRYDSQTEHDRPAPTRGGASHLTNDSHAGRDRLSPPIKAVKPLLKAAANAKLVDPVYQARISKHIDFCIADISHYHFLNLDIALAGPLAVKKALEKETFPDMHTPIKDFMSRDRLKKIVAAAEHAESVALSNAKATRSALEHRT